MEKKLDNSFLKEIKKFINYFEKTKLTELNIEYNEIKIRLSKCVNCEKYNFAKIEAKTLSESENNENKNNKTNENEKNTFYREVKSPLVGIFHPSYSPNTSPLCTIGTKVKKGDVVCIIESMKIMNEVTTDCEGKIVEICVKNDQLVEYGQVLFKLA